jgi:hypothetical protein
MMYITVLLSVAIVEDLELIFVAQYTCLFVARYPTFFGQILYLQRNKTSLLHNTLVYL